MPMQPLSPQELAATIQPESTILFLGAGASFPSGAPLASDLAKQLSAELANEDLSNDLTEVATILENRYGRPRLVESVRSILGSIQPTGGLLSLPAYPWHAIYTTNYDHLIETSYQLASRPLNTISSNYDYGGAEQRTGTRLYKIYGTLMKDSVDGIAAKLVLTERDYQEAEQYREALFACLSLDMMTKSTLVIGHSLRDSRLQDEMRRVHQLHANRGAPGRLFLLSYETDPDRVAIQNQRGFAVASGSIDRFLDALAGKAGLPKTRRKVASKGRVSLPAGLVSATIDVAHAKALQGNPTRLFSGSPASYGDIRSELTFQRSVEAELLDHLQNRGSYYAAIIGVAGVGKTTVARRILFDLESCGYLAYEHKFDFGLRSDEWIQFERQVAAAKRKAVLLVDDCPAFLNQFNRIAEAVSIRDDPSLLIILTSSRSQWLPRSKSPRFFEHGRVVDLRELTDSDLERLLNLIGQVESIRRLVTRAFLDKSRASQYAELRRRCRADMYVCLRNVFATEDLDNILLREYAELQPEQQDIYRSVAALEAAGTRIHRQLLVRLLGIPADTIRGLLNLLEGLVGEYDIDPDNGLYGWATRHPVVAERIAYYKYGDQRELYQILLNVIECISPAIELELRTIRDLCNSDYGIRRLADVEQRIELYRKLINLSPGERIPRHRLISEYLRADRLADANQEIRLAEEQVGIDRPIGRYKVRAALQRADRTRGILDEDRIVMFAQARALALANIQRFPDDKYAYMVYGDVAEAFSSQYRDTAMIDDAIARTRRAVSRILDPQLGARLDELIQTRSRF